MKKLDYQLNIAGTGAHLNSMDMEINFYQHIKERWERGGCITVGGQLTQRKQVIDHVLWDRGILVVRSRIINVLQEKYKEASNLRRLQSGIWSTLCG